MLLKCAAPRAILSVSNKVVIPAARRDDHGFEPKGYAIVNGEMIETGCRLEANITILEPIADAACYQVQYYPEIMVFAEPLQVQAIVTGSEFAWSLVCEEI
ncbi:MAG: hypothetical protein U1E78_11885 [Gammaproteobacteria bacterium]